MSRLVRAALTQTKNAYLEMPDSVDALAELSDKLPAIRDANIEHHVALIAAAKDLGVQVLCMGELFAAPYFALDRTPMWQELAEDAREGVTVKAMQAAASAHEMLVVAPIYEIDSESGKRFNTALVVERDGSVLGKYRKCHIPEGSNDAGSFCETFYYQRSDGKLGNGSTKVSKNEFFPVFETSVGKLGVAICYDRHFPGVMKALAEQGAEIVFSPAVTFGQKSQTMWDMEFAVDAARHNLFIGGSNRVGREAPWNQEFFGASYFVGPNGRADLVRAPQGLVVADLDLEQLTSEDPSGWNFARDLRPDIY